MDIPTSTKMVTLPDETWARIAYFSARQNSPVNNTINHLVARGIEATLRRWPNLEDAPTQEGQ